MAGLRGEDGDPLRGGGGEHRGGRAPFIYRGNIRGAGQARQLVQDTPSLGRPARYECLALLEILCVIRRLTRVMQRYKNTKICK